MVKTRNTTGDLGLKYAASIVASPEKSVIVKLQGASVSYSFLSFYFYRQVKVQLLQLVHCLNSQLQQLQPLRWFAVFDCN